MNSQAAQSPSTGRLLLVDDDAALCELLQEYLHEEHFQVDVLNRGDLVSQAIQAKDYDLLVLDVMLPGLSGTEVLQQIRGHSNLPVLMLTARGDDIDRIIGLEMGADDYLPKPCNPRELLARIRAVLRRAQGSDDDGHDNKPIELGDLLLRPGTRSLEQRGQVIELTSTEFSLLLILMKKAGRIVSKETLSEQGLGRELGRYDRSIDMHLSNIRRKLGPDADGDNRIETVRGVGYMIKNGDHS